MQKKVIWLPRKGWFCSRVLRLPFSNFMPHSERAKGAPFWSVLFRGRMQFFLSKTQIWSSLFLSFFCDCQAFHCFWSACDILLLRMRGTPYFLPPRAKGTRHTSFDSNTLKLILDTHRLLTRGHIIRTDGLLLAPHRSFFIAFFFAA